ncbi:MAG TPA: bifunctional phosphoglucose/phosphomannose isomerase [Caldisericia bacterium]|nr:bifunctional phosphoglucose/phosphomannose isomerase [Caldisericia bacterium]HQL66566.1 bifunctional phosphoglucose/phosphomannose isomerase [Caldisericia bacterium]
MDEYKIMFDSIYNVPEDIEEVKDHLKDYKIPDFKFNKIVFLGTGGGSRAAFDIISTYLFDKSPYPIFIYQGYEIPQFIDKDTLVIACSYSGETEETISSLEKSIKKTDKIIIFSSNGKLEKISNEKNLPFIKLKKGYEARQALHIIFFSIILILEKFLELDFSNDIDEVIKILKIEREKNNSELDKIVNDMIDRIPVIYGSSNFSDSIAERFRRQLNENGKILAHSNIIPNLHHDEIVGFMDKKLKDILYIILLRDHFENEKIKKRFDITREIFKDYGYKVKEIYPISNSSKLARIFSLIFKIDLISIKFSKIRGFNPKDVEIIKKLKEMMKNE